MKLEIFIGAIVIFFVANIYFEGKPEITYYDAMNKYYENYKLKEVKKREEKENKHKYVFGSAVFVLISLIIFLYFKK